MMKTMTLAVVGLLLASGDVHAAAPTDNPVASYYSGDRGYPAWTDGIKWANVIDMKSYPSGKTNFEKFENACRELSAKGGGVLYYPAGTYDFSEGPFDGPGGRGLMLSSGVVIRGEAPKGKPLATAGKLNPATKFVFGFKRRTNAIDVGKRLTLVLDGGEVRVHRRGRQPVRHEPAELILSFAIEDGKISAQVKAFRRGYGRDVWTGKAKITESGKSVRMSVEMSVPDKDKIGSASYDISIKRSADGVTGKFTGECRGRKTGGKITGHELTITPETPRDWNLIGLAPPAGGSVKDVNNVGIAWVHIVGGAVYFGPDIAWGDTWATAGSWKSAYVMDPWSKRKPDGAHPWDPLAGGGRTFRDVGDGRLVFGCVLEHSAVLNESVSMGRPDNTKGFGPGGFYMYKFGPRLGVYGTRVFIANNVLAASRGRNFKYAQTTRRTWPKGGSGMGFDPPRKSVVFFDYNKTMSVDVNKCLLGLTKNSPTGKAGAGFFCEGVTVIDNWVYNNGHKGFNVSGNWVTVARNHNERHYLKEGWDPERIGGWEMTLDGHLESSPGGNGAISDNLSRAFDLAGRNLWAHRNTYNNLGSDPGNDGEGILCQAHGGSQVFSWAVTYNKHDKGGGETGYIGGWDVNMAGALFGWNVLPGWIGSTKVGNRVSADTAFVANRAGSIKPMKGSQVGDGPDRPAPPADVKAEIYKNSAVKIAWRDKCDGEAGFRVDRKIAGGRWTPIAYRPPQITGHTDNPPVWIDFLAPSGRELVYRVAALNAKDDDSGASKPAPAVKIGPPNTWTRQVQTATTPPPAAAMGKLDPGDASWNIRLVELWGRDNRGNQRNMDIYPRFKNGRWSRAIVTARRFNTSIHFVDRADVTLDGLKVKGKLEITVSPDRWVPKGGQLTRATVDFSATLKPAGGERPFSLVGKYTAVIGGQKVTGRVEGYVEAAEKGFETSRWSVNLNQVRTRGAPDLPMLQVTVAMTDGKVKWGSIGAIWRRLSRPCPVYLFDAKNFTHNAGVITGTIAVPARAVNVAADTKAVTEVKLTLIRIQELPGGRVTLTTKLGGRIIDGPRVAMGRGTLQIGPSGPPSGLWRYEADKAPWWVGVKGFKPVRPGEHPRMLFRKADVPALRAKAQTAAGKAIVARLRTLLGNNGDSLPTTFNTTPPHNHNKSPKFPPGVFTTWHGSGYGMLYQLTGDRKYAELARQAVQLAFDKRIDRDNRYSWFKPGTSLRAGSILAGIALAYDLCYDAWSPEFRTRVAREIQNYSKEAASGETITLKHLAGRGGYPPGSNHYGAYLGAGAAVLAILGDPGTDGKVLSRRLAEFEQMLVQILCQGFGDHGWYAEGYHPSRVSTNCGMQEFIAALRNAAGRDYVSARPNVPWLTLRWIMEIIPDAPGKPTFPSRGVYGGEYFDGAGMSHSGDIAYGFGGITPKYRPALLWVYQNFIHPHRANYGVNTYPHRAVNAFVNWPADVKAANPAEVMPKTVVDTIHGYFACRNRWKDSNDILITNLLHIGPWGYHRVKDSGHFRVWGLGVRARWKTDFREAIPVYYKAYKDGSMGISIRKAGKISSLAVDFSGVSGAPAVLVGVGPAFDKASLSRAEAKNGATAKAVSVKAGGLTYHVVTLQKGDPPKAVAAGSAVRVGNQRFWFDEPLIGRGNWR